MFLTLSLLMMCSHARGVHLVRASGEENTTTSSRIIPNNLIFVVADNWEDWISPENKTRFIGPGEHRFDNMYEYWQRLIVNMNRTIEQYSTAGERPSVLLFDTKMCEDAVREAGSQELYQFFRSFGDTQAKIMSRAEEDGQRKDNGRAITRSDICRIAALWKHGGYYFDVDMESRMDARQVLEPGTEFVTVQALAPCCFFTSFIGATKGNPILRRSLDNMVETHRVHPALLGTYSLKDAYSAWQAAVGDGVANTTTQLFIEGLQRENDGKFEVLPDRITDLQNITGTTINRDCQILVYDPPAKKIVFWSRILRGQMCD